MIAGLGEKTDYLATVPNVDASKLNLTDEERELFVRVGRAAQISALIGSSHFSEAKTIALLLSLRAKGAITPARVTAKPPPGVSFPANEQVDLSDDRKREILEMEQAVDQKNHFELLGVTPQTPVERVREIFYELSRRFHPDRFFQKNIGSYRARIEVVYRKISHAHDTITEPAKRAAYLKANPGLTMKPAEPVVAGGAPVAPARELPKLSNAEAMARETERRERFTKHPYFAKGSRIKELLGRATEHMKNEDWGHAFTDLHMANQIDATNDEVKKKLTEVRAKNDAHRAENELKRGLELYENGNENGALAAFKTALNINGHSGKAAYMAAKLMWDKSHDSKDVLHYAQKAAENEPKNPDYHVLLAKIMDQAGMKALAKKHYETALELDPKNVEAKKHVKGRWPF